MPDFLDILIFPTHVKCFTQHSKTDQYREGAWVIIAATGKNTCPVNMLKNYLFRPLVFKKSKNIHVLREGKLSYTTCRELFKDALAAIPGGGYSDLDWSGLCRRQLGTHTHVQG